MTRFKGYQGKLKLGGDPTAVPPVAGTALCVVSWDASVDLDLIEATTTCSNGWRQYEDGLKGATGTFKAFFDGDLPPTVKTGDHSALVMSVDPNFAHTLSCKIIVKTVAVGIDMAGLTQYTVSWTADGAVTETWGTQ